MKHIQQIVPYESLRSVGRVRVCTGEFLLHRPTSHRHTQAEAHLPRLHLHGEPDRKPILGDFLSFCVVGWPGIPLWDLEHGVLYRPLPVFSANNRGQRPVEAAGRSWRVEAEQIAGRCGGSSRTARSEGCERCRGGVRVAPDPPLNTRQTLRGEHQVVGRLNWMSPP